MNAVKGQTAVELLKDTPAVQKYQAIFDEVIDLLTRYAEVCSNSELTCRTQLIKHLNEGDPHAIAGWNGIHVMEYHECQRLATELLHQVQNNGLGAVLKFKEEQLEQLVYLCRNLGSPDKKSEQMFEARGLGEFLGGAVFDRVCKLAKEVKVC